MLKELQSHFIENITKNNDVILSEINEFNQVSADSLMHIYRNNYQAAILHSMELTYPVVQKLVGDKFFNATILEYIKSHLPLSGNMDDYGKDFSDFLENFPPASSLKYLPDVAKMEWLFHKTSVAHQGNVMDIDAFSAIPQDKYFNLKLTLHSSVNFMQSQYPIDKIWSLNQENTQQEDIDLDAENGVSLLFIRKYLKTDIITLAPAEYVFLQEIKNTGGFYKAFDAACAVYQYFDLEYYLKKHISCGTLSGFVLC